MNQFSEYEKINDSLKKLRLSDSDLSEMEKLKWVVTEKVHGANFSFIYENNNLRFAKRKRHLDWTDDFFGFQLVVTKLEDQILHLFEHLSSEIPGTKYVIYGELFGGRYPHPDVNPEKDLYPIQTGIYYTPGINFYAFDIAIERTGPESKFYLDYESSLFYFTQFGIFHAKPLFIGKFSDATNFNTRINSSIPGDFKLPELKDNLIEGIVIKPFNQTVENKLSLRPVVKIKNSEFNEETKFHQAERWSFIPNVSTKTESLSFITDELRSYVNPNRLISAVSKIGMLDMNNEARVSEIKMEFLEDVITDFNQNNNDLLEDLAPDEKEWILERIKVEINKIINSGKWED